MEKINIKYNSLKDAMMACAKGDLIVTFSRFGRGECFHGYEGRIYSENGVCYGRPKEAKIILEADRLINNLDNFINKHSEAYWFATYKLNPSDRNIIEKLHTNISRNSYNKDCKIWMMEYRKVLLPMFNPDIDSEYYMPFIVDAELMIANPAYFNKIISDARSSNINSESEVDRESHKSYDNSEKFVGHCNVMMMISTVHLKQNKTLIIQEHSDNIFELQILRDTERMIKKALVTFEEFMTSINTGKLMVTIKYLYPFNTSIHPTDLDNTSIHIEKMEIHWKFDDASPFGIKIKISDITREIIPNIGEVKDKYLQEYQKLMYSTGNHLSINRYSNSANHVSIVMY